MESKSDATPPTAGSAGGSPRLRATSSVGGAGAQHGLSVSREEAMRICTESGLNVNSPPVAEALRAAFPEGRPQALSALLSTIGRRSPVARALTKSLAVPDWANFTKDIRDIYDNIKATVHDGTKADYIPILKEQDAEWFGVSVCTVDGQMFSCGNCDVEFSMQSCVKPLMYSVAVEDAGISKVHEKVGIEASGLAFNEISLDADGKPHNPMINAGAMICGSFVGAGTDAASRFRYFTSRVEKIAGGRHIGFSQPTYLCELETAWRNNALLYYMTDAKALPDKVDPQDALDFYIQCCSLYIDTTTAAVIAGTLATGGVCPLTNVECLDPVTAKVCLTLMFSCGLYDYSGTWCADVGLPAKSSVSGLIYVVIPHVMGIAVWSPPLDSHGNSVRGLQFFKQLLQKYPYGIFDQIVKEGVEKAMHDGLGAQIDPGVPTRPPKDVADITLRRVKSVVPSSKLARSTLATSSLGATGTPYASPTSTRSSPAPSRDRTDADGALRVRARSQERWRTIFHRYVHVKKAFDRVTGDKSITYLTIPQVQALLGTMGISTDPAINPYAAEQVQSMVAADGVVHIRSVLERIGGRQNIIVKALLQDLTVPQFREFIKFSADAYNSVKAKDLGGDVPDIGVQEIREASPELFGVAICTVDGQQFSIGDCTTDVALMETIKPMLLALASQDCGVELISQLIGSEPTAADPTGFSVLDTIKPKTTDDESSGSDGDEEKDDTRSVASTAARPQEAQSTGSRTESQKKRSRKPVNAFMTSGALTTCALIGRGHRSRRFRAFRDSGSRFDHVMKFLSKLAGNQKFGYSNPTFLGLKQNGLKTVAVSHFAKGMGCYPARAHPADIAEFYHQTCSITGSCEQLATVAATLANVGVCPLTGARVVDPVVIRSVMSQLYSCGLNQHTGRWSFTIGFPASAGRSGMLMAIVPNVMGIAVYSPRLSKDTWSTRALEFCKILSRQYRLSIFEHLVFRDSHGFVDVAVEKMASDISFWELCHFAREGDIEGLQRSLSGGTDPNKADVFGRTALHAACAAGQLAATKLLVTRGATILHADMNGHSPLDLAKQGEHQEVLEYLQSKLAREEV